MAEPRSWMGLTFSSHRILSVGRQYPRAMVSLMLWTRQGNINRTNDLFSPLIHPLKISVLRSSSVPLSYLSFGLLIWDTLPYVFPHDTYPETQVFFECSHSGSRSNVAVLPHLRWLCHEVSCITSSRASELYVGFGALTGLFRDS